ncbi:MAG TPA: hypothetical protein DDY70_01000 [Clostridiales bacterium]|nr:hypothetical protein [Clostridiales bacterium]
MFICSVRASTVRFFAILALTLAVLVSLLAVGGQNAVYASAAGIDGYDFSGIKEDADRVAFLLQFGIEVKEGSAEEESFTMPENFDRVMMGYNEVQKMQGLDISKYQKKKVTRYTYEVTNAPESTGPLYATLLVYRGRVIGCDVSTADPKGFVKPLTQFSALLGEMSE